MKAYVLCILIATLINVINEKYFLNEQKKKILGNSLMLCSLLFICFIAGIRDYTVGYDIKIYVTRLYDFALSNDIFTYLKYCNSDFLFALIVYIGSLFKNLHVVLFLIELAVSLPIYTYAYKSRKENSFSLTILIFLLTMYCVSLSLMRQSVAMSICILAYYYYNNDDKKKAYLTLFLAILCHKTAIIFLLAFFINKIVHSNHKLKKPIIIAMIVVMALVSLFIKPIVLLTPYSNYLDLSARNFSIGAILKKVFWLTLTALCLKNNKDRKYNDNIKIALIFLLISLFTTITSFYVSGTGRIGYYFTNLSYFIIMFEIPKKFKLKNIICIFLFIVLAFSWWISTCVKDDSSRVYPYHSNIIKIFNNRYV